MREIKFRAWWKCGSELLSHKFGLGEDHFNMGEWVEWTCELEYAFAIEQYIGLKDKNGVEIYEGDIIYLKGFMYPSVVEYADRFAQFEVGGTSLGDLAASLYDAGYNQNNWGILGNKHENPELLEEK